MLLAYRTSVQKSTNETPCDLPQLLTKKKFAVGKADTIGEEEALLERAKYPVLIDHDKIKQPYFPHFLS